MANIKRPQEQAGGASIGSQQGGAPDMPKETDLNEQGRVHKTRTERGKLSQDPNLNQASNERGSQDQTQGSQTGNEIENIPNIPEPE